MTNIIRTDAFIMCGAGCLPPTHTITTLFVLLVSCGSIYNNIYYKVRIVCLFVCPDTLEVRPTIPYIFKISDTRGTALSMSTWLSFKKKAKNDPFSRIKNGATGLKFGIQTQLNSLNNMRWVQSGHTPSSLCVRTEMVLLKKHFDLISCSVLFLNSTTYIFKVDIFVNIAHLGGLKNFVQDGFFFVC